MFRFSSLFLRNKRPVHSNRVGSSSGTRGPACGSNTTTGSEDSIKDRRSDEHETHGAVSHEIKLSLCSGSFPETVYPTGRWKILKLSTATILELEVMPSPERYSQAYWIAEHDLYIKEVYTNECITSYSPTINFN